MEAAVNALGFAGHTWYDAYGRVTCESNAAVDFLFAFTGRERDEETGLQYHRARYYDPLVGRWISEDPIGFAAGDGNLTRYVANRTTTRIDPFGQDEQFPGAPQSIEIGVTEPKGSLALGGRSRYNGSVFGSRGSL
jgi:RHS repeat-associated protein